MSATHLRSLALFLLLLSAACGCTARADDWPQWLGPQRDAVWRETGILEKFPAAGPKIRWRTPVRPGFSGPVVADGRVFLTDRKLDPGAKVNDEDPFDRSLVPEIGRASCRERV